MYIQLFTEEELNHLSRALIADEANERIKDAYDEGFTAGYEQRMRDEDASSEEHF